MTTWRSVQDVRIITHQPPAVVKSRSRTGFGRGTLPETLSCGVANGEEGDGVDLDLRVQQQAGDLHGGARGRVFRKELSADACEHSVGTEVCQIGLDADHMVHA